MNSNPLLISLFTLSLALPVAARAQVPAPTDGRWASWFGCWEPAARSGADAGTLRCILPAADGRSARMVTLAGARIALDETVRPDGVAQSMTEKDCSGQRESRWAKAGPRLFFSSTLSCAGQPDVKTTGLSALVTADQWLDVQVVNADGREQVRTRRFWRSSQIPPEPVADVLRQLPLVRFVPASVVLDDVLEASGLVAHTGVEAWLAESAARVPVDRRALIRLDDAHVSRNLIDLMVALAYPKKFEVERSSSSGGGGGLFGGDPFYDGFGPAPWGALADMYGLGLGAYGMSYYSPYYYLGTNGGYLPGGYASVPVGGGGGGTPADPASHGQVVNGQGYTHVQPREAYRGTTSTQSGSGQSSSAGADSSGGVGNSGGSDSSGGASPAGYSGGGGGSSTGLTAVPR